MEIEEEKYETVVEYKLMKLSHRERVEFVQTIVTRLTRIWQTFDPKDIEFENMVHLILEKDPTPKVLESAKSRLKLLAERTWEAIDENDKTIPLKNASRSGVIASQADYAVGALSSAVYALLEEDNSASASYVASLAWSASLSDPIEQGIQERDLDNLLIRSDPNEELKIKTVKMVKSRLRGQMLLHGATKDNVDVTQQALGFPIPDILVRLFLEVANGGFGPGNGLIGVRKGNKSEFGGLATTYEKIKSFIQKWPDQLLPFNDWGDRKFSCVDCKNERVFLLQNSQIVPQDFELREFFEIWICVGNEQLLQPAL